MKLPFLSTLKKTKKVLTLPDSLLVKRLKNVADENYLLLFEDIVIYHHTNSLSIPILIVDWERGIFIFEHKDWSYNMLKNKKAQKANNQEHSKETLAFDNSNNFIKRKFKELEHIGDSVPVFNYVLMENMDEDEYEYLDDSFKKLLPKDKILFNNSSPMNILSRMHKNTTDKDKLPDLTTIISTLFVQYTVLNDYNYIHIASKEQREFIDTPLPKYYKLISSYGTGKTSSIILKTILQKLQDPDIHIIIIKPTLLACEIIKKKIVDTLDHCSVDIDMLSVEVLTPKELINRHHNKLKLTPLNKKITIDPALFKNRFQPPGLLIVDDCEQYTKDFIDYATHLKKKNSLIVVENTKELNYDDKYSKKFINTKTYYHKANQLAKALYLISTLLQKNSAKDILIVADSLSLEKLKDDLKYFIEDKAELLDSTKKLINQNLNNLRLSTYEDTNSISSRFVILMDIDTVELDSIIYAHNLAIDSAYILFEDESENLSKLRNEFENYKE